MRDAPEMGARRETGFHRFRGAQVSPGYFLEAPPGPFPQSDVVISMPPLKWNACFFAQ